ncbi:MAG: META domain-containing protein [Muribaculaceae bacterium]|nr:META domain-containing protein [Muribaculaceae bacterium]
MNKIYAYAAAATMGLFAVACTTTQKVTDVESLNGEWNIVSVDGKKLNVTEDMNIPTIKFNTSDGTVSGNLSCNRMVGSFDVKAKPGTLDLSGVGATKMLCPDMSVEDAILRAFGEVKGYELAPDSAMLLTDAGKNVVMTLERMRAPELNGEYKVIAVGDTIIGATDETETEPVVMTVNPAEGIFSCTTDCNTLMGKFAAADTGISFSDIAMTRMACPQAPVQDALMKYLPEISKATTLVNGNIGLYDESGQLMIILSK